MTSDVSTARRFLSLALLFALALALTTATVQAQSTGATKQKTTEQTEYKAAAKSSATHEKLDINVASKDELEALPGIGPVMAQKIIDNRPYRAKSDLVTKKVIPQSAYQRIKDQIIAHQVK